MSEPESIRYFDRLGFFFVVDTYVLGLEAIAYLDRI
jgi:hypothetical protein